jgi:hypothetical protein
VALAGSRAAAASPRRPSAAKRVRIPMRRKIVTSSRALSTARWVNGALTRAAPRRVVLARSGARAL